MDTRPFAMRVPVPVLHSNAAVAPQDDSVPVELEDHHRELEGEFTHQTELPPNYDIEYDRRKPWTRYPMGYPRFAAFIANDEDRSTTIFRRFQRLSSRNLLYLESELAYLEAEQDRLDQESSKSHELTLSMKSWNLLCLQATPPREQPKGESEQDARRRLQLEGAAQERLQLAWRIREVLATYHESLKRESEVLALDNPDRRPLKGTRKMFIPTYDKDAGTGTGAAMIAGQMRTHLDRENEKDLCVLAPPIERDRLTRLLEGRLSYFFRTKNEEGLSDFISHHRVSVAVTVISGILATIFLIGAILGLYWVKSPNAKLGMLSGLTVAFAGSLALFTNARRQDVFAATAAYAAVLVVFVSGNLATSPASTTPPTSPVTPALAVTSTVLQTSTVLATLTSTFSVGSSPAPSSTGAPSSGFATSDKIALGIGLGIGVPMVFVAASVYLLSRRRREVNISSEPM
ncbi:hypothetical protein BGZ57DRAFT_644810 [Hyaloscypha finlandica]|nr:hypothetical protein BGZ57DRAFT_644810 [Hyaloscypha finlandica]